MKKMTKFISLAFAAALLALVVAMTGCASGGSQAASSAPASSEAASAAASSAAADTATSSAATSSKAASSEPASSAAASSAASTSDVQLQVFAANSLSKAMDEAQALYTKATGVTFADTQYLSSGDLNAELEAGAYADIEITASKKTMDDAEEAGYIDPATRTTMFVNDLVMVTAANSSIESIEFADISSGN